MIKLIVSDIDGTLLEDGGNELNPELLDVILQLREKGMQFAAATGRQWLSIESLFAPIKEKIFYVSDNGAYVGCHGRALYVSPMERELAMSVAADIKAAGMKVMMEGTDVVYLDDPDEQLHRWLSEGYKYQVVQVDEFQQVKGEVIKVSAYLPSNIEAASKHLWPKYQNRLKMTLAGDMWLDFMAPEVNKGQAVKLLQESMNITPKETMVFGDQMNDIEMLEQAYYSFAIGNARPEVKAAARFQADTNIQQGVLKILKLLRSF